MSNTRHCIICGTSFQGKDGEGYECPGCVRESGYTDLCRKVPTGVSLTRRIGKTMLGYSASSSGQEDLDNE